MTACSGATLCTIRGAERFPPTFSDRWEALGQESKRERERERERKSARNLDCDASHLHMFRSHPFAERGYIDGFHSLVALHHDRTCVRDAEEQHRQASPLVWTAIVVPSCPLRSGLLLRSKGLEVSGVYHVATALPSTNQYGYIAVCVLI